ncbi:hypothetical protein OE88DRAFT_1555659 [Heliocybe sulcata]|uniref:Uncharacterized protein n=1 Tax=Heliocybe sulcata TaxID=5364 RepID=A0A5C3N236_9AGAM|nr:hypothetical protein OE88DRAFT_1555659 [Heliocybe sulcata]
MACLRDQVASNVPLRSLTSRTLQSPWPVESGEHMLDTQPRRCSTTSPPVLPQASSRAKPPSPLPKRKGDVRTTHVTTTHYSFSAPPLIGYERPEHTGETSRLPFQANSPCRRITHAQFTDWQTQRCVEEAYSLVVAERTRPCHYRATGLAQSRFSLLRRKARGGRLRAQEASG